MTWHTARVDMTVSLGRGVPAHNPAFTSHIIPGRRGAVINNKLTFFQLNEIGGHLINFHFVAVGSVPFDRRPTRVGTRTSHDPHSASTCHHALCACPLGRKICNFPVITSGVFDVPVATNLTQVLKRGECDVLPPNFMSTFLVHGSHGGEPLHASPLVGSLDTVGDVRLVSGDI